ncbi:MAG: helix-turn-helix domain-containing protein [Gemmatimonadota bacterium]
MSRERFPCRSHCPINYALETFGDKWTLLIIRDLMFKAKSTYGDFLSSDEGMSTNILADRLKRLEKLSLVTRSRDPENGRRWIYALTEKGRDLLPIMLELTRWSAKYDARSNAPEAFVEALRRDREGVIDRIRAGWTEDEDD